MLSQTEKTLLIANNLWYLSEGMLGPLFGVYCARFGASPLDISWVWALYLITMGFIVVLIGYLSDFCQKEKLFVAGYFMQALFTFAYLFVDSQWKLGILQMALGVSSGLATTTWYVLYSRHENPEKQGLVWGLANGLTSIYTGIALLIGGFIITYGSFEWLFVCMGCVQLVAASYVAIKLLHRQLPPIQMLAPQPLET